MSDDVAIWQITYIHTVNHQHVRDAENGGSLLDIYFFLGHDLSALQRHNRSL
jgi:hypothetical protein